MACSALRWLLDELFALQIADISIKIFSEEQELAQLMVSRMYQNPFTETLFQILVRMLQALQKGEVVAPRAVRLGLVSTWLHVIAKLGNDGDDNFGKDNELRVPSYGFQVITRISQHVTRITQPVTIYNYD